MQERKKSTEVFEALKKVTPGGVNSPARAFKNFLDPPIVAKEGRGSLLIDVDGNEWIDYVLSWGSLIHGHAHPRIVEKAEERVRMGSSFGMTTESEEKLAKKIIDRVSSVEKVRFVSSGTEATMSAVRLARAFTKRELIVKFSGNYHGHADLFLVKAGSGVLGMNPSSTSAGVLYSTIESTICLPYNNQDALRALFKEKGEQIAAVILEPIAANMGVIPATEGFIGLIREETRIAGALMIFDEVITGFRVGKKGAQSIYAAVPDITCFGKIVGGGFPAAAFGGREEIMNLLAPLGPVYQAGTLSGNPVAMECGLEALVMTEEEGFYEELEQKTAELCDPITSFIQSEGINASLQRAGSMFTLFLGKNEVRNMEDVLSLNQALFKEFFLHMLERGILIPPCPFEAWFISSAHTPSQIEKTLSAVLEFLETLIKKNQRVMSFCNQ